VNKGATSAERSDSLDISAAGSGWADSRRRASEPSAPVMRDQLGQVEGGRGKKTKRRLNGRRPVG
jgi:hypothetical protein